MLSNFTDMHLLHVFLWFNWSRLLPVISPFILAYSTGGALPPNVPDTETDTLVWIWTFCMTPWGQNRPTVVPSSSVILIMKLSLQRCPGRHCLRFPAGEVSSTVLCSGGRRVQVTLLRGAGRQGGSKGTDRRTGVFEQSLSCLHSDRKAGKLNPKLDWFSFYLPQQLKGQFPQNSQKKKKMEFQWKRIGQVWTGMEMSQGLFSRLEIWIYLWLSWRWPVSLQGGSPGMSARCLTWLWSSLWTQSSLSTRSQRPIAASQCAEKGPPFCSHPLCTTLQKTAHRDINLSSVSLFLFLSRTQLQMCGWGTFIKSNRNLNVDVTETAELDFQIVGGSVSWWFASDVIHDSAVMRQSKRSPNVRPEGCR